MCSAQLRIASTVEEFFSIPGQVQCMRTKYKIGTDKREQGGGKKGEKQQGIEK
jgi:hypothetical protein